jgi:hypothetical protein
MVFTYPANTAAVLTQADVHASALSSGFLATVIPEERNAPSADGTLRGESSSLGVSADLEPAEIESWTF